MAWRRIGPRELLALAAMLALLVIGALPWTRGSAIREAPVPTTVVVVPHVESVLQRGQAQQFTATVLDQHGDALNSVNVTWSVTPRIGAITRSGLFVATTDCLRWDGIGLVVATWDPGDAGGRQLRDGALVAIKYDPACLPPAVPHQSVGPGRGP